MVESVLTPTEAGERYARWIARTGLADSTKQVYPARVRAFLEWLTERWDEYADALTDPHVRDWAVRDYRHDLMTVDKRATNTVELAMSAVGSFYDYLGLGRPAVKRQSTTRGAPKGLDVGQVRKVMRVAERRGPRDYALAATLFLCAVRVAECAALDTDDVLITDRTGTLHVRYGKGGEARKVPIPSDARPALRAWLAVRRERYDELGPLFMSREGGRLSKRRMQSLIGDIGVAAGVDISPHTLRHTFALRFLEEGGDLASLQEVLGHKSLSSTQVYTRPNYDRVAELADRVRIDL